MAYGFGGPDDPTDTSQDPLFYRGRTPVLGQDVEVRLSGQLPSDFPQAGKPTASPSPPAQKPFSFPGFPAFEFPGFSFDFSGQPTAPQPLAGSDAPFQAPQWWQLALASLEAGQKGFGALQSLGGLNTPTNLPEFSGVEPSGMPETAADLAAKAGTQAFSEGAPSGLAGGTQASIGNLGGEAGGSVPWASLAGPALQTLGGAATLAQGGDTRSQVLGGAQTAAGVSGLLATSGIAPALAGVAPALTVATLPLIVGAIYEAFHKKDDPVWPEGYTGIPGQDRAAVDPSTGAVLWYTGHGHYDWSPQTQANQKATPEELLEWGIFPAGALLQDPAYRGIIPQLLQAVGPLHGREFDPSVAALPEVQAALAQGATTDTAYQTATGEAPPWWNVATGVGPG